MIKIDTAFDNARKFAQDFANDHDSIQGLEISSKSPLLKLNDEFAHNFYNGDDPEAPEYWMDIEDVVKFPKPEKYVDPRGVETSWKNTNPARQILLKSSDERMAVLDAAAARYAQWEADGSDEECEVSLLEGIEVNEQKLYNNEMAFVQAAIKEGIFTLEDFTDEMD